MLANLDEVDIADTSKNVSLLKAWITEPTISINRKGLPIEVINNFARFIFTSNNITNVIRTATDRRFFCLKTNDVLAKNTQYFDKFHAYLKEKKRLTAFYDFLMARDISKFNIINDRPQTDEMEQTKCISPFQKFIIYLVETQKTFSRKSAKDLIDFFKKFCEKELFITDDKTNSTNFGKWLNEIEGIKKIKGQYFNSYEFDIPAIREYLIRKDLIKREIISEEVKEVKEVEEVEEVDIILSSSEEEDAILSSSVEISSSSEDELLSSEEN